MNRYDIIALIAARTGKLVETAMLPDTRQDQLADELRLFAQMLGDLAADIDIAAVSDGKLLWLQQELERRVGVLTEWGPLQTTPNAPKTDPSANHTQS